MFLSMTTRLGDTASQTTLIIKDFDTSHHHTQQSLVRIERSGKTLGANSGLAIRCGYFNGVNFLSDLAREKRPSRHGVPLLIFLSVD